MEQAYGNRVAHSIPVFYTPLMVANSNGYSPSPSKPSAVVTAWLDAGLPININRVKALDDAELAVAHDPDYIADVLSGRRNNGHGNRSISIAATLPYTCGAMVAAADAAIDNGVGAVAPVSGFHHAGYDYGGGFCTFNGLMVAAMSIDGPVGILDFDEHWGNGTDQIIRHLDQVDRIEHFSQGRYPHPDAEAFLEGLPAMLERFEDCRVVLYQAGADCHIDDPLGGFLTTQQIMRRDAIVFSTLRRMGVPVAWNLAGGYQEDFSKVIEIHTNTMRAFADSFYNQGESHAA